MNKIYVIIVTYNAMNWIDKCLGSLLSEDNTYPVIIDNCSKDNTISYVKEHYPEVHVIVNKQNKGFGQANNQGIEYAYKNGATHFFLLNQDAWVENGCIELLVKVQNEHKFAIVSPIHLNGLGDCFDYGFYEAAIERMHNVNYVSDSYLGKVKEYYKARDINAAAWMLSRETIETIGGFDPLYFHYGEDMNYCQRIMYHNKEMVFVPGAIIHHDRLQYGNATVYKRGAVTMTLLINHSDINSRMFSLNQKNIKTHIFLIAKVLKCLVTIRWKEMGQITGDIIRFYCRIPEILNSRKQNRIITHNWLKI